MLANHSLLTHRITVSHSLRQKTERSRANSRVRIWSRARRTPPAAAPATARPKSSNPSTRASSTTNVAFMSIPSVTPAVSNQGVKICALLVAFAAAFAFALRAKRPRNKFKVVILGAGFAGVQCARDLMSTHDVEVVEAKEYFEFVPGTLAALVGGEPLRKRRTTDADAKRTQRCLMVPYEKIFKRGKNGVKVTLTRGRDVYVRDDCVIIRGTTPAEDVRCRYDALVIATGTTYAGVIKSKASGRDLTIDGRLESYAEARASIARGKSRTVVVGGGVVGVELAAELAARAAVANNGSSVVLLHAGPRLLEQLPESISSYATRALVRAGVEVCVGQKYSREGDGVAFIGAANKNVIRGDYALMAIGSTPATEFLRSRDDATRASSSSNGALEVPLDRNGRIRIDESTRAVVGRDRVYAVGDVASKSPEYMLASYAHWEAEYVAHRIKCDGNAKKLVKLGPYVPPPRFMAISLGSFDGVFVWGDRVVATGIVAAVFKAIVQFWFIRFLPAPYGILKHVPHMRASPVAKWIAPVS